MSPTVKLMRRRRGVLVRRLVGDVGDRRRRRCRDTVSTKLSLAVPPLPSVTVIVIVAVPDCPAAGVIVTVRFAPLPPNAMLAAGTRVGVRRARRDSVSAAAAVSTSPTVKACGPLAVFSAVVLSVTSEIVGRSLTAVTVSTKLSLAVPPLPSATVSVIVAVPD